MDNNIKTTILKLFIFIFITLVVGILIGGYVLPIHKDSINQQVSKRLLISGVTGGGNLAVSADYVSHLCYTQVHTAYPDKVSSNGVNQIMCDGRLTSVSASGLGAITCECYEFVVS
jgi:hypothetical protein